MRLILESIPSDTKEEHWEATNWMFPEIAGRGTDPDEAEEDFCEQLNTLWPVSNGVPVTH